MDRLDEMRALAGLTARDDGRKAQRSAARSRQVEARVQRRRERERAEAVDPRSKQLLHTLDTETTTVMTSVQGLFTLASQLAALEPDHGGDLRDKVQAVMDAMGELSSKLDQAKSTMASQGTEPPELPWGPNSDEAEKDAPDRYGL